MNTTTLRLPYLAACLALAWWSVAASAIELTAEEAAGRRLYREGLTGSGEVVTARVGIQSMPVSGAAVRCVNCHGADGQGRPEGGLRPPDITWRELSKPYGHRHDDQRVHPAFDLAGLTRALAEGRDPAGQRLDPAMPRYALSSQDVVALAAYLRRIADDRDPGVAPDRLRIGTLLPGYGPLADSGRYVSLVLQGVFARINAGGGVHGRQLELVTIDSTAADWQARLNHADVFALVSPLTPGRESAVQTLVDKAALPVVGPLSWENVPQAGQVFLLAAGESEQARVLAEFAVRRFGPDPAPVAVVSDAQDRGVADAITDQLARHGWQRVMRANAGIGLTAAIADWQRQGVVAVFYLGAREGFGALQKAAADIAWQPAFLAPAARVPASARGTLYVALPVLPDDGTRIGRSAFADLRQHQGLPAQQQALLKSAYAAATVLVEGLKRSGRAASRERLIAALETLQDFDPGVMPPVSFGPGRRVGSAGAHVLQMDADTGNVRPVGNFLRVD